MKMEVLQRLFAAVIGGYLFSNIIAILVSYLLPANRSEAVMVGVLLSFIIYTATIIWAFSARTVKIAWCWLLLPALISTIFIFLFLPENLL
jgi:hypothetical protein